MVLAFAACSGGKPPASSTGSAVPDDLDHDLGTSHVVVDAAIDGAAADAGPPDASISARSSPTAGGVDFIEDAKLLYRIAACGNAEQPVDGALAKIVDRHCKRILAYIAKFRAQYFVKHRAWFDKVVPADAPNTVVYPFGGGDLISALVAFPNATEITTVSLEQAGDPRRLRTLEPAALESSLGALRGEIGGLISVGSNTSENLSKGQRNELPGQVSSFLLGLVAAGYEPVSMKYLKLTDAGEIRYIEQADIDAADARGAKAGKTLKHDWLSPSFSEAFQHVEIRYQKPGEDTIRVHRHFGWNLGDDYLEQHAQLIRHLEAKGKVTLLTKGASYLLWRGDFSIIRNYMLANLAWMLSDSTGIPPVYAKNRGMVQETYGAFSGAFLEGAQNSVTEASMIELWAKQPRRRLGFRFGYVDKDKQAHLMVTRPKR
ncbi:MAG TPA: hypothetical protein VK427_13210 [Kofleriaceae bacterium]|nr:hypothetical protein [Kofleriaceae bacterium]